MADELKNENSPISGYRDNFDIILPRDVHSAAVQDDRGDKQSTSSYTGTVNTSSFMGMQSSANILRNPTRRFYDPEITTTAIYLPKDIKRNNRWCRWFYDHDEMIGAILDVHAELPYSRAKLRVDDPVIQRAIDECLDKTNFFSMLPLIDLEYMKVGEVFIYTNWSDSLGMWDSIVIHNPDFIEVKYSPFADRDPVLELTPDEELRSLVHSRRPEDQQLKKRLPQDIVKRVLTGRNIMLSPSCTTHIARRSNPYDLRGTSILRRLFRLLQYEDKLREAQITIADNFIYPLKIFKLGDENKGWIPNANHQKALAQMLQQANFDPNFSLIYHYGLKVDIITVADKLMKMDTEWTEINKKKCMALGISEDFLMKGENYACFTEGTQVTTPDGKNNIENISKDTFVIDKNGTSQKVLDNWCEGVPETLVNIKLWGGKEFQCTSNHKWPIWAWPRNCACGCGKEIKTGKMYAHSGARIGGRTENKVIFNKVSFVKCFGHTTVAGLPEGYDPNITLQASEIKKYDYLMIPRKFSEIKTNTSREQARLLGYFLAEGNYSKHHTTKELTGINLTFNVKEKDTLVKDALDLCKKIGLPIVQIEENNKKNTIRLRSANRLEFKDLIIWFKKSAGEYSYGKKLSEDIMRWPLFLKEELIKGIFRGDGSQTSKVVMYTTTSEVLAYQVELILAQLGFIANWTIQNNRIRNLTSVYKRRTTYRLDFHGKFALDLANLVWGEDSKVLDETEKKFQCQKAWVDDNYVYVMVKSVEVVKNTKKVYNLTVENSHSYLVHNIGTFNSANVGLQMALARYKAKRDLFEIKFLRDKFLRVMAEKNGWYQRDAREIVGQYRVTRKGEELNKRLILPQIIWDKKLVLRDDQQYLTFLNNVYSNGKGPVSVLTMLTAMGLTLEEELSNKEKQRELEEKFGVKSIAPLPGGQGAPLGAMASKIMDRLKFGKKKEARMDEPPTLKPDGDFVTLDNIKEYGTYTQEDENNYAVEISKDLILIDDQDWKKSLQSKNVPQEVITILSNYNDKLEVTYKRSNGKFASEIQATGKEISDVLGRIYLQGKLWAYGSTNFLQVSRNIYAREIKDFSDILMVEEFRSWVDLIASADMDKSAILKNLRTLGNTCFSYGQLKGYQEQGIETAKLSNVIENDGIRYEILDLLTKRHNLASLISPRGDIILFSGCIEGNETVDPHIERYKDFISNGIRVSSCPVEFIRPTKQYLDKVGRVLKKKYDTIYFVPDVIDLPEWEEHTKKAIEKDLIDLDKNARSLSISSSLMYEKLKKRGNLAIFNNGRHLYVSNWIGTQDKSIIDNLIKHVDIYQEIEKSIDKAFEKKAYDLTRNELETYRVFGYIEPIMRNSEVIGWRAVDSGEERSNEKIKFGKAWDSEGICINETDQDSKSFFFDNLKLWIEYPHKLEDSTVQSFNKIF